MPDRDKTQVWKDWYNHIKGSDWPKCDLEKDYNLLPDWVKEKLAQEFSYIPRPKTTNDLIYLTSGIHQIEALGLYKHLGYQIRGPYGAYKLDPFSIFMEKKLKIA